MLFWATPKFVNKIYMHLTIAAVQAHHVKQVAKNCLCVPAQPG